MRSPTSSRGQRLIRALFLARVQKPRSIKLKRIDKYVESAERGGGGGEERKEGNKGGRGKRRCERRQLVIYVYTQQRRTTARWALGNTTVARIGRLRAPYRVAYMRAGARARRTVSWRYPSEATGYHRRVTLSLRARFFPLVTAAAAGCGSSSLHLRSPCGGSTGPIGPPRLFRVSLSRDQSFTCSSSSALRRFASLFNLL